MINVVADIINKNHIIFTCPFCFSRYKKNGEPYRTATRIRHIHGSSGDLSNRIEHRTAHCDKKINNRDFNIHITDDTVRL